MEKLSAVAQQFVLHWGEMGTRWGLNRTVAQIHALLFLAAKPLDAEEIAETLDVARSNVSTGLRELQGWGLIRVVHLPGERRDHFASLNDVWEMFRCIIEQRKRREIDPTIEMLRRCATEAKTKGMDPHVQERLATLHGFLETLLGLYGDLGHLPISSVARIAKLSGKARRLLGRRN